MPGAGHVSPDEGIVGSPQTRQNGALFCDYNDIVITTLIIKLFLIEIYAEVCGGETY